MWKRENELAALNGPTGVPLHTLPDHLGWRYGMGDGPNSKLDAQEEEGRVYQTGSYLDGGTVWSSIWIAHMLDKWSITRPVL